MSNVIPYCVFCRKTNVHLKLFSEDSLNKCRSVLTIRKANNLAGNNTVLPTQSNNFQLYHSECYRRYTALPPKYRKIRTTSEETPLTLPQNEDDLHASAGTSGLTNTGNTLSAEESDVSEVTPELEVPENVTLAAETDTAPEDVEGTGCKNICVCFFCGKSRKKIKGREEKLSFFTGNGRESILKLAIDSSDSVMTNEILNLPSDKDLYFHKSCKNSYITSRESILQEQKDKTEWHFTRNIRVEAYEVVEKFVAENIISQEQSFFLKFLNSMFIEHLKDKQQDVSNYTFKPYHLKERLLKKFPKQISIISFKGQIVVKPFKGIMIQNEAEKQNILDAAARILHDEINEIKCQKLPDQITTTNLIDGECEIPEKLISFYTKLISGENYRRRQNIRTKRLAKSFSEDIIYAVLNGRIKSSKHICLGMTLKSLTNSKKIINIVNRYGHCCSYSTLEGLETEATFTSCELAEICPEGILRTSYLYTGVAFDNYDRFVETTTGKDTLHVTVGIIFQITNNTVSEEAVNEAVVEDDNVQQDLQMENNVIGEAVVEDDNVQQDLQMENNVIGEVDTGTNVDNVSASRSRKHRRSFDIVTPEQHRFIKKVRLIESMLPSDALLQLNTTNVQSVRHIDFAWVLSHYLELSGTPMWVGYNSLLYEDQSPKHIVCYLTTINSSPTNKDTIYETMIQSQKVALECGQKYIEVTYDLAIAKVALQIKSTEANTFGNLFIHLGAFHIMMAYFKAVGKFIDNCGLSTIMVNEELLANGSVNGFITGKHFNRCKRLHPLIALALKMLHFQRFIHHEKINLPDGLKSELLQFQKTRTFEPSLQTAELTEIFHKYEQFTVETLEGKHGKTPQYYMMYVRLIDYYLMLTSSIRTSNFEMFQMALLKIVNLYFTFNQPNYARYLVKYLDNLIKVDETHPGLRENFEKGSFGIKRTKKPFSKQPIDLTLEQTINADAANKLTGISHVTNSISARQRWCRSHTIRSTIISHTMQETGLSVVQDVTKDLNRSQIKKSTEHLHRFIDGINRNINPFDESLDKECLYNISTGEAAPEHIEKFLLNIEEEGRKKREDFIFNCVNDPAKFEQAIKRVKCHTFVDMTKKKKNKVGRGDVEVRMQRDLFGQLLQISLKKELDLDKVLSYPLTTVPLSLFHLDGTICKTTKSALMALLEKQEQSEQPQSTDIIIYDGYFMLYQMKDVPLSFGNISKKLLQMICANRATIIVIAFDRYIFPSIKDTEHKLRGMEQVNFRIDGPDQVRKKEFSIEMKNINFKEALIQFIIENWEEDFMAPYMGNKTIYMNTDACYRYMVIDGKVVKTVQNEFSCPAHEEADTKMIFHACQIDFQANVTIRCSDTDVLVIMLANMAHVSNDVNISMEVGVGKHIRFINVTQLYESLGSSLSAALPAFHAFTGCDFNPAFFRKGKKRPFTIMSKSEAFTECFVKMSQPSMNREDVFAKIQEFTCQMYSFNRLKKINDARVAMFQKTYKFLDNTEEFKLPKKGIDGSSLPPCESELYNQYLRACYIAQIWSHAHLKVPSTDEPSEHGWEEIDNRFEFHWFSGTQLPTSIEEITIHPEKDDNDDDDMIASNSSDSDSDSEFENIESDSSQSESENE